MSVPLYPENILRLVSNNIREKLTMYGKGGVAPIVATTTTVGVVTLPNTGGNIVVSLAIAVASGLVVWGVLYARSSTR